MENSISPREKERRKKRKTKERSKAILKTVWENTFGKYLEKLMHMHTL